MTLEGVKSDAIFAYQPPFNILALLIGIPLKFIVTPRWFHKINVAAVRVLNAPLLLFIGIIERRILWAGAQRQKEAEQLPKFDYSRKNKFWNFSRGFSVHGDIQAVFDMEPTREIEHEIEQDDDLGRHLMEEEYNRQFGTDGAKDEAVQQRGRNGTGKSRRDSVAPFIGPRDLMSDSDDGDGVVKERLDALEMGMGRIEKLLGRLCEALDDGVKRSSSPEHGETGTLRDLDQSGDADLDD